MNQLIIGQSVFKLVGDKASRNRNDITVQVDIVESSMPHEGTIVNCAQEHYVEAIVVGTRGTSEFAKQLLGRVALGVTTFAHCTVIVVR